MDINKLVYMQLEGKGLTAESEKHGVINKDDSAKAKSEGTKAVEQTSSNTSRFDSEEDFNGKDKIKPEPNPKDGGEPEVKYGKSGVYHYAKNLASRTSPNVTKSPNVKNKTGDDPDID
jgi:hypothetical protein